MEKFHWTSEDERRFLESKNEYAVYLRDVAHRRGGDCTVVVDVGANNGMFSIQCARALPAGSRVYAFEPFAMPFACLSSNAAICNAETAVRIEPVRAAVAEEAHGGELDGAYLPNYSLLSGFHVSSADKAMLETLAGRPLDAEFATVPERVPCVRLDRWMSEAKIVGAVHLLKVDVEKSELGVLRSLGARVADVDAVLAEVHEATRDDVLAFLERSGFAIVSVSDPAPPTFCMRETIPACRPISYDPRLSTYLVWAKRPTTGPPE